MRELRAGQVIEAASADELFSGLLASVEALDRLAEPPLTTAMAVARLRRYLPDPVRRIDLHDLIMDKIAPVSAAVERQAKAPMAISYQMMDPVLDDYLQDPQLDLSVGERGQSARGRSRRTVSLGGSLIGDLCAEYPGRGHVGAFARIVQVCRGTVEPNGSHQGPAEPGSRANVV